MSNQFDELRQIADDLRTQLQQLSAEPKSEKKYCSIREASQQTGTAEITWYRGVADGSIPAKRVGRRILIPSSYLNK